jgi:hypothetical protein
MDAEELSPCTSIGALHVGFSSNQIPLRFKLRKDRKTKFLLLLNVGITERYIHFNPL